MQRSIGFHPVLRSVQIAMDALAWIRLRRSKAANLQRETRRYLGDQGERHIYFHLRRLGYVVVARQWRAPHNDGEIDLIAWHDNTLCFLEAKSRLRRDASSANYRMDASKQQALRSMAAAYVRGLPESGHEPCEPPAIRFDGVFASRRGRHWTVHLQQSIFSPQADSIR